MPAIIRQHIVYPQTYSGESLAPDPAAKRMYKPQRWWTENEIETLKYLCANGHSYAKIGKLMDRAEGSVYKKATTLGINKIDAYFGPKKAP